MDEKFLRQLSIKYDLEYKDIYKLWVKIQSHDESFTSLSTALKSKPKKRYCHFVDRKGNFCKTGVKDGEIYCQRHLAQIARRDRTKKNKLKNLLNQAIVDVRSSSYNFEIEKKEVDKYNEFIKELKKTGEL